MRPADSDASSATGETPASPDGSPIEEPSGAPEPTNSAEAQLQQLRQQLERNERALHDSQDRYLRERAELENFKRRMQREKAEALHFACEPLIRDLLPVVDNLERALAHDQSGEVVQGVRLVLKSLLDVLSRHGVRRIEAVGEPFDPARHEAMMQTESGEHEPNRVIAEHQTGYYLHDRLLRPSLVTVSTAPATVESAPDSD